MNKSLISNNNNRLEGVALASFKQLFKNPCCFKPGDKVSCLGFGPCEIKYVLGRAESSRTKREGSLNYLITFDKNVHLAPWQMTSNERKKFKINDTDCAKIALEKWIKPWIKKEEEN